MCQEERRAPHRKELFAPVVTAGDLENPSIRRLSGIIRFPRGLGETRTKISAAEQPAPGLSFGADSAPIGQTFNSTFTDRDTFASVRSCRIKKIGRMEQQKRTVSISTHRAKGQGNNIGRIFFFFAGTPISRAAASSIYN